MERELYSQEEVTIREEEYYGELTFNQNIVDQVDVCADQSSFCAWEFRVSFVLKKNGRQKVFQNGSD